VAAPQRRSLRHQHPAGLPSRPPRASGAPARGRKLSPKERVRAARARRRFVALVVLPALLMLGSVYAHVTAGALSAEAARLEEERAAALVEAERLQLRVEEAAGPERVREAARRDLGMTDPTGEDMRVYEESGRAREGRDDDG